MDSLTLADILQKPHNKVLRDIRDLSGRSTMYQSEIEESSYFNSRGKECPLLTITGELLQVFNLKYVYNTRLRSDTIIEKSALATIEHILNIRLERQYPVGKYRIDGYHKQSNTAYEIDEAHHLHNKDDDMVRQKFIEGELGCKFIRIPISIA